MESTLEMLATTRRDRARERVKIRFRLLGPCLTGRFAVSVSKRAANPFKISPQKGRALLAYLAMQPEHFARREDLANLLWGDRVDEYARHNLRQCLVFLRGELASLAPDFLIVRRDAVALCGRSLSVDALEFAALARSAELSQLDRALKLYRGEFLAGSALDVEPFSDWVMTERHRLHTTAVSLFEQFAKQSDALGNGDQAINAAERLISLEPWREDWHRLFLRICARHRSPEAADTHAKWLRALLRRELDVALVPATVALIEDIPGRRIGTERFGQSAIQ